jgi:signal transduction histidine kinase/ligand-binding sensor domain-containing protein
MRIGSTRPVATADKRPVLLAVVCLAVTIGAAAAAEPLPSVRLRNWDVDAGLPSPRAFAVAHTPDGYVWIGSYAGLCRFDGLAFTVFTPRESLAIGDPAVTALAVDAKGVLWGGTEQGYLFTRGSDGFEAVAVPEAAGLTINAIQFGADGTTWLATRGGAVAVRGDVTRVFGKADGLSSSEVWQLVLDAAGTPWALAGGRVHRFSDDRWQPVAADGAPAKDITAIAASRLAGVWCAERAANLPEGRVSRVFRITATDLLTPPERGSWPINPDRSRIHMLGEDEQGRLWCGTRGGGVHCREQDGRWWPVERDTSLSRADGIAFATDREGSVWIGTRSNGVYQVDLVPVQPMPLPGSLEDHVVTTVAAGADGRLWAGTDGGGVVCWQNEQATVYGPDEGLPSRWVTALARSASGRIYVSTLAGVAAFDGDRFVGLPVRNRTGPIMCDCLLPEGDDAVWVGTRESTVRIDPAGPIEVLRGDGERLPTMCLAWDRAGRLLALGRDRAIYEYVEYVPESDSSARGGFEELVLEATEPFTRGRVLAADEAGGLWVGSYGSGLGRIADGRLRRWSQQSGGLPNSHVLAIIAAAGVVWVGAENGIFGCPVDDFARSRPGENVSVWRITQAEGLPEKVCTAAGQPAACVGPDGRVWMGNGRSVAGFLPEAVMKPLQVFPPQVDRVLADGVLLAAPIGHSVAMPVGTRRLEVRVTSPNTVAPERLIFRHRLMGFDDDWVPLEDRRIVSYTGLPPGSYRLLLEVRGPNSTWQGMADALTVRIPPRFWQRRDVQAAAGAGFVCLVAAAGWAGERWRSQRRLERIRIEQAREQERQRIARDIHDDIGSGLTEIVMLSHLAGRTAAEAGQAGDAASAIGRIEDRARRLTRSMDEVVWAINPKNDSLEGFITYFHHWAQAFLGNAGIRVRWDLPLEPTEAPLSAEVRHELLLACKEGVTNIVKHSGAEQVRIRCRPEAGGLEILIQDDGRGFVANESGRGHGLDNLRDRLAAVGGRCDIRSAAGRGTEVQFVVAVDRLKADIQAREA